MPDEIDEINEPLPQVRFNYLKSNFFRVVHVDGAVGGLTPSRLIHAIVYSERAAIPRIMVHEINEEGDLVNPPLMTEGKEGFVREMEVDLMMSVEVARKLSEWLLKRLADADKAFSEEEN